MVLYSILLHVRKPRSDTVHKVTAFITWEQNNTREILVFQRPNADLQLPAGTVERGEDIEAAVIREAREETGIDTFHLNFHSSHNGWSHINYIEYDRVPNPQYIQYNITGWVPDNAISFDKPRHFYHLTTPEQTPDQWSTPGDGDHIFKPFWTPLSPKPSLVPPQAAWLDSVYDQLRG